MATETKQAFSDGFDSAIAGIRRVAPQGYKITTPEWRAWYAGYDYANESGFANKILSERALEDQMAERANNCQG